MIDLTYLQFAALLGFAILLAMCCTAVLGWFGHLLGPLARRVRGERETDADRIVGDYPRVPNSDQP